MFSLLQIFSFRTAWNLIWTNLKLSSKDAIRAQYFSPFLPLSANTHWTLYIIMQKKLFVKSLNSQCVDVFVKRNFVVWHINPPVVNDLLFNSWHTHTGEFILERFHSSQILFSYSFCLETYRPQTNWALLVGSLTTSSEIRVA